MYWPVEGEEEFGDVSVRLLTTYVFAEYTIRHLRLSKVCILSRCFLYIFNSWEFPIVFNVYVHYVAFILELLRKKNCALSFRNTN